MEKSAKQIKKERGELEGRIARLASKIIYRGKEHAKLMRSASFYSHKNTAGKVIRAWAKDCRKSIMALRKQIAKLEAYKKEYL